ncbi:MAG: RNB domain-containing ribonuclease, partial [Candidatus Polarisedimenticolia bacterium]
MNETTSTHRHDLKAIARRAMIERGLAPDFPPEVEAELERRAVPAPPAEIAVRDLRDLLWVSIDNDDSR